MKPFLDDNFLLETKTAELLYHEHASTMPIIDFHNHLPPQDIAENTRFENLTQVWLNGDHYKWRAMRANGIDEKYITGDASDYEKFEKWAETVPYTLRNPLYHWTHLELKRYFGIDDVLNADTALAIYDRTSELLASDENRVWGLLGKMNVEVVCTTDDPVDSLEYHKAIAERNTRLKAFPTWRPDNVMKVTDAKSYNAYINKLSEAAKIEINSYSDLIDALQKRQNYFADHGCRLSDHGVEEFVIADYTNSEVEGIFKKVRCGTVLGADEVVKFKTAMLNQLGQMNHAKGWVQQFHIGPIRNNNSRLLHKLGSDTGFDSMGDMNFAPSLSRYLDNLDRDNKLAKTILYNINPKDNEMLATMMGNFQDGTIPGKMQYGSGWWFLDQKDGMEKQLNALSNHGLLSRFVGMLTDSRSFLSFTRHEYFRRILCNILGNEIESGLIPNDKVLVGQMVENICYNNAKKYFKF